MCKWTGWTYCPKGSLFCCPGRPDGFGPIPSILESHSPPGVFDRGGTAQPWDPCGAVECNRERSRIREGESIARKAIRIYEEGDNGSVITRASLLHPYGDFGFLAAPHHTTNWVVPWADTGYAKDGQNNEWQLVQYANEKWVPFYYFLKITAPYPVVSKIGKGDLYFKLNLTAKIDAENELDDGAMQPSEVDALGAISNYTSWGFTGLNPSDPQISTFGKLSKPQDITAWHNASKGKDPNSSIDIEFVLSLPMEAKNIKGIIPRKYYFWNSPRVIIEYKGIDFKYGEGTVI